MDSRGAVAERFFDNNDVFSVSIDPDESSE